MGDIMIHVGDIMSTVGVFSTVGYSNNKRFPPTVLNTPTVLKITPTVLNTPMVLKISPTVLNTPTVLKISPRVLMISPTVLNTLHGPEHPHGAAHALYRVVKRCNHELQLAMVSKESMQSLQKVEPN